jgi:hypothetical protein
LILPVTLEKHTLNLDKEILPHLKRWNLLPDGYHSTANGVLLDIMTIVKGLENKSFDECQQRVGIADLTGARVPFLHIKDLLANKSSRQTQGQLDVSVFDKIKKYPGEEHPC